MSPQELAAGKHICRLGYDSTLSTPCIGDQRIGLDPAVQLRKLSQNTTNRLRKVNEIGAGSGVLHRIGSINNLQIQGALERLFGAYTNDGSGESCLAQREGERSPNQTDAKDGNFLDACRHPLKRSA